MCVCGGGQAQGVKSLRQLQARSQSVCVVQEPGQGGGESECARPGSKSRCSPTWSQVSFEVKKLRLCGRACQRALGGGFPRGECVGRVWAPAPRAWHGEAQPQGTASRCQRRQLWYSQGRRRSLTCSWSGALQKNSGVSNTLPRRLTAACRQTSTAATTIRTVTSHAGTQQHTERAQPAAQHMPVDACCFACTGRPQRRGRAGVAPSVRTLWMKTCPMRCATSSDVTLTVPCSAMACGMCFVSSTSSSTRSS